MHIAIVCAPNSGSGEISVHREVELTKAALLYGDSVELISPVNDLIRSIHGMADDSRSLGAVLSAMSDAQLKSLAGPTADLHAVRQVLGLLASGQLAEFGNSVGAGGLPDALRAADELQATLETALADLRDHAAELGRTSGAAELSEAGQLLRLNNELDFSTMDSLAESVVRLLKRYLLDPNRLLLADGAASDVARAMIREGHVVPPRSVLSGAQGVRLGAGLIARLPSFPQPPMSEVVDLRSDLEAPLARYRIGVAELRSQLHAAPFDGDRESDIDDIWRFHVAPSLDELRAEMADHSLVRECLRALRIDLRSFVKDGVLPGAGIAVVLDRTGYATPTTALATGVVGYATTKVAQAQAARRAALDESASSNLFYLYELNDRLGAA